MNSLGMHLEIPLPSRKGGSACICTSHTTRHVGIASKPASAAERSLGLTQRVSGTQSYGWRWTLEASSSSSRKTPLPTDRCPLSTLDRSPFKDSTHIGSSCDLESRSVLRSSSGSLDYTAWLMDGAAQRHVGLNSELKMRTTNKRN
jgi:hypothetical protein